MSESRRYLSTKEAAEYCGSTESSFEKLRGTGSGAAYNKIGRKVVYDIKNLDEWMSQNTYRNTSDPRLLNGGVR